MGERGREGRGKNYKIKSKWAVWEWEANMIKTHDFVLHLLHGLAGSGSGWLPTAQHWTLPSISNLFVKSRDR